LAWIIGWDLILEYAFGAATVAVGWSGYVVSFLKDLGINFPIALSAAPGTRFIFVADQVATQLANTKIGETTLNPAAGYNPYSEALVTALNQANIPLQVETAGFNLPGFLIAVAVTLLLIKGIKESARCWS
jgi:APA family basic amino acid/polyamine antiporter